jgi:mxaJ protein
MPGRVVAASLAVLTLITLARPVAAPAVPVPAGSAAADGPELRVCADPNNLPFSNARGEGLENRLADLLARELGATVRYTWWAARRGFVRNTLGAGLCDVILGVPVGWDPVLTTRPYYASTYVFVSRPERALRLRSLDDPRLERLRIGVQLIGVDATNAPPAHALARRGIVDNVVGFTVYGDYAQSAPSARIIDAVAAGTIDTAIVWGPLAGYFAPRARPPLEVTPLAVPVDEPGLRFTFAIAAGVRKGDHARRDTIDAVLGRRRAEINALLDTYHVPRAPAATGS